MPTSVRPRVLDGEVSNTSSDEETSYSDRSFDLSSTLTRKPLSKKGKGPVISRKDDSDVDDDTELEDMIRRSITRRNVKDGTELLKNTKGKKRLTKGEVGGGSFQSMGTSTWSRCE